MVVSIVTTATRTHLIHPDAIPTRLTPNGVSTNDIRTLTACGQRVDGRTGTHEGGSLTAGITCASCRRTRTFTDLNT